MQNTRNAADETSLSAAEAATRQYPTGRSAARLDGSATVSFMSVPSLRSRRRPSRQSRSSHLAAGQSPPGRNEREKSPAGVRPGGGGGGEEDRRSGARDDEDEAEEEPRRRVASAEAEEEVGVAGRPEEGPACERGAYQCGGRREAEEDLDEEVVAEHVDVHSVWVSEQSETQRAGRGDRTYMRIKKNLEY
ncbi:hypothetical protein E2562_017222 [Oryza meyeriana var. granulata]|uniref:Uncharacterized protein n=1 Tax=Oryza meyeriana var. granulata TaxID=110450 RepID=A0A6G1ELI8_9ORYZ|nr:hypothetical protein E2562_017222 [Oryza meyeriana var. granulata]